MLPPGIRRTLALSRKEALHLARDPQAIALIIVMPLLLVVLFGYAVSFDVETIPTAVSDLDDSASSRALTRSLSASGVFEIVAREADPALLEDRLQRGEAKVAVVIPPDFARQELRSEAASWQILVDGADTTTAQVALGHALAVAQHSSLAGVTTPLEARPRMLFNPRMLSSWFVIPGVVAIVLAILSVILTALAIAREWERGSMEQLFSTPVGRLSVMLGKILPYLVLGLIELMIVLTAGRLFFDVPIRGPLITLVSGAALFLVCALGQGLFISTVTRSQQLATQLGAVSSLLPSLLLSGFIFPIENMPLPLQIISNIVPARWLIPILRGTMLQGSGFGELWTNHVALAALGTLIVAGATRKFRRRLD